MKDRDFDDLRDSVKEAGQMRRDANGRLCACGFRFAGPGQFRNCTAYQDRSMQWWVVCPECKLEYKSD